MKRVVVVAIAVFACGRIGFDERDGGLLRGDIDGDGCVSCADLAYMKSKSGTLDPAADVNGDGHVNSTDIALEKTLLGTGCAVQPTCP